MVRKRSRYEKRSRGGCEVVQEGRGSGVCRGSACARKAQETRSEGYNGMELTIPNPNESAKKELCGWCGGLLKKNLWCSGCMTVAYCGTNCQLKAWPNHKKE